MTQKTLTPKEMLEVRAGETKGLYLLACTHTLSSTSSIEYYMYCDVIRWKQDTADVIVYGYRNTGIGNFQTVRRRYGIPAERVIKRDENALAKKLLDWDGTCT